MLSPFVNDTLGFLAIIGVMLTSYMGTQAQALVGKREYGGHLGRATRLAILTFAPIFQVVFSEFGVINIFNFTFLEWIMVYFAIVGNITAIQRAYYTWKRL